MNIRDYIKDCFIPGTIAILKGIGITLLTMALGAGIVVGIIWAHVGTAHAEPFPEYLKDNPQILVCHPIGGKKNADPVIIGVGRIYGSDDSVVPRN